MTGGATGSGSVAVPAVAHPPQARWTYLPGLDGIRALAVTGVLLYHADLAWMPGGFLGVDVFFVLSGFLISSLLLSELQASDRIRFGRFYQRRARRLLPALFAVLAVCALLAAFVATDAAAQLTRDIPPALAYVLNWSYIVGEQSYFEAMGRPAMLGHLWSLAVEEQFYIIWPTVMLLAWRLGRTRAVAAVAVAGSLAATAWMAHLATLAAMPVPNDASRLYFGTDTHAMGVLIGAALAMAMQPRDLPPTLRRGQRAVLDTVGLLALAGVIWAFASVSEYSPALYRGGFAVLGCITAVLVAAAAHPAGVLSQVLGIGALRWLGERSYGIYLWHWPVFVLTRPGVDIPFVGPGALVLRLGLVLAVAEASYRYLEMPVRRGALGRSWARLRASSTSGDWTPRLVGVLATAALLLPLAAVLGTADRTLATSAEGATTGSGPVPEGLPPEAALASDDPLATAVPEPLADSPPPGLADPQPPRRSQLRLAPASATPTEAATSPEPPNYRTVRAYGDSVILGAFPAIRQVYPRARVRAEVSQHIWVVMDWLAADQARNRGLVVIHTGNNGPVAERDARRMLGIVKRAQRVVVINQSMPRRWEAPNNKLWRRVAADYANVRLVDWHAASRSHPEYFARDQVHMNWEGARKYAKLIRAAATGP